MDHRYVILGLVYSVIFFATLMLVLAVRLRNVRSVIAVYEATPMKPQMSLSEEDALRLVPRFDTHEETMAEIHARYAALAETDPREAGRLKYEAQLKIHGK